ncbi:MAG: heavy-metal-associated domain-containing protein [Alphaproteobacteria bacterium]|nr:heavy-metal-associated domain-containing protein [Alphaproteobacteria bacterium]
MATVLKVEKMHCRRCAKRVTSAIMGVAPQSKIDIDIEGRRVTIDGVGNLSDVTKALADAGYPAQNA